MKPLDPYNFTAMARKKQTLGHWIDRFFPEDEENFRARKLVAQKLGSRTWEEMSQKEVMDTWRKVLEEK